MGTLTSRCVNFNGVIGMLSTIDSLLPATLFELRGTRVGSEAVTAQA